MTLAFPNENALLKILYLRTQELHSKWEGGHVKNRAMFLNSLWLMRNSLTILTNLVSFFLNIFLDKLSNHNYNLLFLETSFDILVTLSYIVLIGVPCFDVYLYKNYIQYPN